MNALKVMRDKNVSEFLNHSSQLLYSDEATNSLLLGMCGNIQKDQNKQYENVTFLRIEQDHKTKTCAILIPDRNLILTYAEKEHIEAFATYLNNEKIKIPALVGPTNEVEIFNNLWKSFGHKSYLGMTQKIYKIEKVCVPSVVGELSLAGVEHTNLIAQWLVDFGDESLPPPERKSFSERLPHAEKAIQNKLAYIWLVNGEPVSMAHVGRLTQNGISVSGVFTPNHLRRNGYASALVAHLSQKMLESGKKFCVLYTDLTNPTSNKIYQNVGYQEVSDSIHYIFE